MRVPASFAVLLIAAAASAQTDPATVGQWSPVVNWGMTATHAHMLPEGKVLWWPEFTDGNNPTLWDPATETNSRLPVAGYNIFCSGHAFGPDGRVYVFGGHIDNDTGFAHATAFDPSSHSWTQLPDMNNGRWYPSVTALPSGDMFVIAGTINLAVGENLMPQVWQQATSSWRNLSSISISFPTYPWTFVAPSGEIFIAGTRQASTFINTSGTGSSRAGPSNHYPANRTYGSALMYLPGKILIAGGGPLTDVPTSSMEVIDLNGPAPVWRVVGPMKFPRRQLNMTLLPDGNVLITGGHSAVGRDTPTSPVLDVELWNPVTEQTTLLAPAGAYRGYHSTAVLLPDGRVLSAGSTGVTTAQVYSPPYLFHGARPAVGSAPAEIAYGQSFDISSPDAARIAQVTMIRLTSVTHSFNMNQRFNRLSFAASPTAVTAVAPERPEIAPPGHYLLFVLDGSGTPSVGRVVHLSGSAPPPPPPPPPPPGTIAFRGASTKSYPSGSSATMTASIPAGAVPGDLLVASVGFGNSGATVLPALAAPAGWTLIRRVDRGVADSLSTYWHVLASGEIAPVWAASQSVGGDVSISAYSGVAGSPVDVSAGKSAGSASSYTAPTLVTTRPSELIVAGFYAHANSGVPTTWTLPSPLRQRAGVNNGGSRSLTTGDALQSAPGTTPAFVANASALQDYEITYALALVPAAPVAPPPDDFSVAANPATVGSAPGTPATSSMTITPSGAFTGTVTLSVAGNPAGSTAVLDPTSVDVGAAKGTSTLTLSPGTAAAGTYSVVVTATNGTLSHSATVTYTIAPPPPPPGSIVFHGASSKSYPSGAATVVTAAIPSGAIPGDVLVASVGFGNSGATTLPAISTPAGWTPIRRVDRGVADSLATYWHVFASGDSAPSWTTSQSVGGGVSISAYSGVAGSPVDVSAGKSAGSASSYTAPTLVTTRPSELVLAGYYAHANNGIPTTWTLPSPLRQRADVNNGASRSLTTGDAVQSAAGTTPAFLANASVLQDYELAYAIALIPSGPVAPPPPPPDDFSISANPASVSSSQGSTATSALAVAPSGSFSGTVTLSASGNPAGSTASVSPTSVTVGPAAGSSTLTISPGTAAAGTYTITVAATSGALTHSTTVTYTIAPPPPPPGSIVFHGASKNSYPSGSTRTVTAPIPAGAAPGDVLVAWVGFGLTGATVLPAISTPAGWTLVRRVDHTTVNSLAVYWHVYAAGDPAPSWTTNGPVGGDVSISAYAGVSTAKPVDASAVNDAGGASTYSAPTLVTTGPNELLVVGFFGHSASGAATTWTDASPLLQRTNFNNAGSRSLTTADATRPTPGASPAFTATASVPQQYALAYVIALVPGP